MPRSWRRTLALAALLCLAPGLRAQPRSITVAEGDTLEQLALRYKVPLQALIERNGIRDPALLQVGQVLLLPGSGESGRESSGSGITAPAASSPEGSASLLLSPAERRDRAERELRERAGLIRWKWFNDTAVDWAGWRLQPDGVRITLVQPSASDLGLRGSAATAMAVDCVSLRQNWRIDGQWQGWETPAPRSVGQRIVLDLCSNTLDGPALPVPPPTQP